MDETKNYVIEKANQNDLMNKEPKNVSTPLNYIEPLLILNSGVTFCYLVFL